MVLVNSAKSSLQQKLKGRDRDGGMADCVQGLSGRPVPSSKVYQIKKLGKGQVIWRHRFKPVASVECL